MLPLKSILVAVITFSLLLAIVSAHGQPQKPAAVSHKPPRPNRPRTRPPLKPRHLPGVQTVARQFLDAHNKVRAAKREPPLVWDAILARHARRWARQRIGDCQMAHSDGPYGENVFWSQADVYAPCDIVKQWIDEEVHYDPNAYTCKHGTMCGHFTQVVWKDTFKVGCAKQKCNNGGVIVICEYDPPGNYVKENPFAHYGRPVKTPPSVRAPNAPTMAGVHTTSSPRALVPVTPVTHRKLR